MHWLNWNRWLQYFPQDSLYKGIDAAVILRPISNQSQGNSSQVTQVQKKMPEQETYKPTENSGTRKDGQPDQRVKGQESEAHAKGGDPRTHTK